MFVVSDSQLLGLVRVDSSCIVTYLNLKLKPNCQELSTSMKTEKLKRENPANIFTTKHFGKNNKNQKTQLKFKISALTATFLVWCFYAGAGAKFHTDSIDWNRYMHALNGNNKNFSMQRARKRDPFLGIFHQNIPGWCDQEEVGIAVDRLIKVYKPSLLFIGEAESYLVEAACPEGYCFVQGNVTGTNIVRISLLIKNDIKFRSLKLSSLVPIVGVKVGSWNFYSIYREWSHGKDQSTNHREGWETRFRNLVEKWKTFPGNSLVLGDFNFDPLPISGYQKKFDFLREMVRSEVTDSGWTQLVEKPTHFGKNQKDSCIDHIYTNNNKSTLRLWNESQIGQDHNCIGIRLKTNGNVFKSQILRLRPLKTVTKEAFHEEWSDNYPEEVMEETETDSALQQLEFKIGRAMEKLCPEKVIKTKPNYSPWYTSTHAKLQDDRDRMHKLAKLYRTPGAWAAFNKFKNMVRNRLKVDKKAWTREHLVSATTDKQKWNRMKAIAGLEKKKGLEDMKIVTPEKEITDTGELATHMNLYFREKVSKLRQNIKVDVEACLDYAEEFIADRVEDPTKLEFRFKEVTPEKVLKIIGSLTNTGAVGRDGISTAVIKKFAETLAPSICHVVNLSIRNGYYPRAWRWGVVTPLPKAGNLEEAKNWRPVVINCSLSKILERVLDEQMTNHMERNKLYSPSQHAYRESRSCLSCLIDIDTVIQDARNRGKNAALLLSDMSAAFNLISKEVIVPLMGKYGFDSKARSMVHSYLTGRKTQCKIGDKTSEAITLDTGVGEGSVVGPNYFIMSMCSVSIIAKRVEKRLRDRGVECEILTQEFADDTSSMIVADTDSDIQEAVTEMMKEFEYYFNSAGLCLNQSKCEVILFRCKKPTLTVKMPCGDEEKKTIKLLGLWFDSDYQFRTHVEKVTQKVNFKLANLGRIRPYMDDEEMKMYAKSLVLSVINYCAEIYLRTTAAQKKIQRLLNRCMRLCVNAPMRTHIDDLLMITVWLNSSNMYRYACVTALRRLMKTQSSPVAWGKIREALSRPRSHYHLRSQDFPMIWPKLTCHARNAFLSQAAFVYNDLTLFPQHFPESKKDSEFKLRVKAGLKTFYGNYKV